MQNEIPEDDGHCVITGCIARGLLLKPTFAGSWSPDRTDLTSDQKYELTVPYAQIMSTRLKGQPLMTEHDEDNGSIGEILHCWIDDKNDWYMQAVIDRSTRAGNDIIKGMLSETFGEQVCELSLSHEGFKPREVSIVKKGARDGSTVDKIEIVNADGLAAIKNQEYKVEIPEIPDHFPTDTPRICASFANKMSTYTAVRNPTPPVTYANTAHAPSEAVPILNQVNQMRQQNHTLLAQQQMAEKQQQMQQQQVQAPKEDDEATLLKKLNDIRARQQPQTPAQIQFANLTHTLSQPADANNPANTGNIHTLHTNPEDDKLMQIALMFEGRNMLSKEQMEVGKGALLDVAAKSKATRDALAQKEAELEALRQKNADLEQKVNHHEGDLLKQKRQAAALLRKVLTKTNPPLTQQEEKDMNNGENDFANGQTDRAMKQFEPFLIRASALIDAAESAQNVEMEQANVGGAGLNLLGEMQKILNPSSALVQASYYGKHGQKRGYDNMAAASAAAAAPSSSAARGNIWQDNMQYHHPQMSALLQQMEASRGGDDTITLGELQPNRFQRR